MDIFFTAVVLMAAMVIGTKDISQEPDVTPPSIAPVGGVKSIEPERSVHACDPYHRRTILRDLSVPSNKQVINDER